MKTTVLLVRHAECVGNVLKNLFKQGKGPKPDHLPEYRNSKLTERGQIQTFLLGEYPEISIGPSGDYFVSGLSRSWGTCPFRKGIRSDVRTRVMPLECLNEYSKSIVVRQAQAIKEKLKSDDELSKQDMADIANMVMYYHSFYELMHYFVCGGMPTDYRPLRVGCTFDAYLGFSIRYPEFAEGKTPNLENRQGFDDFIAYLKTTWQWLQGEWGKGIARDLLESEIELPQAMFITCDDGEQLQINYGLDSGIEYHKAPCRSVRIQLEEAFVQACKLGEIMGTEESIAKVVILHAKRLIRLRQEIEGFDEAEYQRLIKLNGKNFPQNVSITQYEYEDGVWALIGEPYRLPKGLVIVDGTRRLGFELKRCDFESICAKLKLDPLEVYDPALDKLS